MSHGTKCIFCPKKKPVVAVKYSWNALFNFYQATQEVHKSRYLEEEFESKGFWKDEAKLVDWKIRYQGAKYCPKISAKWNQLKDLESFTLTQPMYGEFSILMSYPEAPEVEEEM